MLPAAAHGRQGLCAPHPPLLFLWTQRVPVWFQEMRRQDCLISVERTTQRECEKKVLSDGSTQLPNAASLEAASDLCDSEHSAFSWSRSWRELRLAFRVLAAAARAPQLTELSYFGFDLHDRRYSAQHPGCIEVMLPTLHLQKLRLREVKPRPHSLTARAQTQESWLPNPCFSCYTLPSPTDILWGSLTDMGEHGICCVYHPPHPQGMQTPYGRCASCVHCLVPSCYCSAQLTASAQQMKKQTNEWSELAVGPGISLLVYPLFLSYLCHLLHALTASYNHPHCRPWGQRDPSLNPYFTAWQLHKWNKWRCVFCLVSSPIIENNSDIH